MKLSRINALTALNIEINDNTPLLEVISAAEKLGYAVKCNGFEFSLVETVNVKPLAAANELPAEAPNHFNQPFVDFDDVQKYDDAVMRCNQLHPESYPAKAFRRDYIEPADGMARWIAERKVSLF